MKGIIFRPVLQPKAKMDESNSDEVAGNVKKPMPSLKKSRREEMQRLKAEASEEIRPLAVGTLAMMISALSNQGR